ncbi:response regulator [Chthonobacter rhizosphaerae]|uniref:response regulator n=1 Tax=Chthonobacter rhizosphaerae TaxID=2735553 RepID=UPI0015EF47F9|nr:response regulator [Chthonobacter rhizosphaerae]
MSNLRVLILEDEFFVALDLEQIVQTHMPAAKVVLCTSVSEAQVALQEPIELALLDIDVLDGKSFPVAQALAERGTPFAFVSSHRPDDVPAHLVQAPFVPKPFAAPLIQQTLQTIMPLAVSR